MWPSQAAQLQRDPDRFGRLVPFLEEFQKARTKLCIEDSIQLRAEIGDTTSFMPKPLRRKKKLPQARRPELGNCPGNQRAGGNPQAPRWRPCEKNISGGKRVCFGSQTPSICVAKSSSWQQSKSRSCCDQRFRSKAELLVLMNGTYTKEPQT